MASATISGTTANEYINSKIEWSSVPDTDTNKSKVTAALYYRRNNSGFTTYGTGVFSITIGGKTASASKTISISNDEWVKAIEASVTIDHNDNGKKSITISAKGSISGTTLTSTTCSGTATLDTIPRASDFSISTGYTTSEGTPYARLNGTNTLEVTIKRYASSFTHKVVFYFGGTAVATYSGVGTSRTVTPSFATWLPHMTDIVRTTGLSDANAPSIVVTTYDEDGNKVGSAVQKRFDIYVPDIEEVRPSAAVSLSSVSSLGDTFDGLYIQGYAKVKASFSGSEAKYGASITSYAMKVNGVTYGSPYESGVLSKSGQIAVKCTVTDSRGYKTTVTKYITVIPYSKPKVIPYTGKSSVVCRRCTEDGTLSTSGTYLRIMAGRKYSKVTADGEQKNFCRLRYRYRTEGSETFSEWAAIIGKANLDTNEHDAVYECNLNIKTSYIVEVGVIDDIGCEAYLTFAIPTDRYDFHLREGGDGGAFGKYAEEKDLLDIAWNARVRGDLRLGEDGLAVADFVTEDILTGTWRCRKWNSGVVEAYGKITVTAYPETVYGSLYYQSFDIDLPADLFAAAPYVQVQTVCGYGLFSAHIRSLSASAMNVFVSNSHLASQGELEVTLFIYAFGKWK